jgi:hypothetical protein
VNPLDLADDDVLLAVLSASIDEADPVPEGAVTVAKAMARLSDVDAELAGLVADSLVDDGMALRHDVSMEPVGEASERLMTFATPRLTVDVDWHTDRTTMVGMVTPPVSVDVDLEAARQTQTTRSDELGRFQFSAGRGPVRLRIHADEGAVVTPWITR